MKFGDIASLGEFAGFLAFIIVMVLVFNHASQFNQVATTVTTAAKNLSSM